MNRKESVQPMIKPVMTSAVQFLVDVLCILIEKKYFVWILAEIWLDVEGSLAVVYL